MMRIVVAILTGIFMSLYFMYFFIPLLSVEHTQFNSFVNSTDTTIIQSYAFGQGFYTAVPLIPILVAGFIIISYALKRDIGE